MRNRYIGRLRFLSIVIIAFVLLLSARLYFVQVVYGKAYSIRANDQYVSQSGVFDRGNIYFQDKKGERVAVATLSGGHTLSINPIAVLDPEMLYGVLNEIVPLKKEDFIFKASKKDDPYEKIEEKLTDEQAGKLSELNLNGVLLEREYWRFYPGETSAAQTLGFVGFDGDRLEGRYGLERYYDDVLRRDSEDLYVNFFAEIFSEVQRVVSSDIESEGDIVLSIEPTVQMELEQALTSVKSEWNSSRVAGLVMDPMTGQIYAMAELPSLDLNTFSEVEDISIYSNSLVERVYEMGSIMKPLTVAAGLDSGAITPNTTYEDKGSITLNKKTISNYDGKARGVVSMQEVLNQSLNTGVTHIVLRMGTKNFADYFRAFGLGEKTGIDLPNEAEGLISTLSSPRDVDYATASFGQGIALSPIATTRALSALANGGVLVEPHVVKTIDYSIGYTKDIEPKIVRQVLKPETSEEITRMLVNVVDDALLGGTVALPEHSIAAKTGTAQIPRLEGRGYYDDRYLHTFFGYFPAFEPRFIIFLMNWEPVGARYASETLTHPFMDLTKFLIQYYEIPPDR